MRTARSNAAPDPGSAFRRSLLLPGWGQWYNGERIEAFVWGGVFAASMTMAVRNWDEPLGANTTGSLFWARDAWTKGRNNWLILAGFTYLLGAVDAYVNAHMKTFDVSPISLRTPSGRGDALCVELSFTLSRSSRSEPSAHLRWPPTHQWMPGR